MKSTDTADATLSATVGYTGCASCAKNRKKCLACSTGYRFDANGDCQQC